MKAFIFAILSSLLSILVLLGGVKPASWWGLHQPRVPNLK